MKITGTMYAYSFLCSRKLWLFANKVCMEHEHENVRIGKLIDENTYEREKKHVMVDDIANIDFLKKGIVHEVKKSGKAIQMSIEQIKYYLFLLKEKGIEYEKGIISIPKEKKTVDVYLEDEDIKLIREKLKEIDNIINSQTMPATIDKISVCRACAYYELCYI